MDKVVYKYDAGKNPVTGYAVTEAGTAPLVGHLEGVPLRDLTETDVAALTPDQLKQVAAVPFYVPVKPAKQTEA